ncbi:hypothetical protein DDZ14_04825 [Maritimibacter sp. 55A14]|nr:hypothetical protein DDZ14_04825 [Maritimibacter sp. 55A14]
MVEHGGAGGAADADISIRWRNGDTGNRLDCETAVLLRAHLRPILAGAESWADLLDGLHRRGFGLAFREGRLFLTDHDSSQSICTMRFLGMPLADLAARLGRLSMQAVPGGGTEAVLLH